MKTLLTLFIVAGIFSSCNMPNNKMNDNSANNKMRMQQFMDQVINAHNVNAIDSFLTTDLVEHQPFPGQPATYEGVKKGFQEMFAAFPDLHATTDFMIADGDTVMAHSTMTGTNTGPFMGHPASNKSFNVSGVDIIVLKDGKCREHWGYSEEMKMMQQMGMGSGGDMSGSAPADTSKKM